MVTRLRNLQEMC